MGIGGYSCSQKGRPSHGGVGRLDMREGSSCTVSQELSEDRISGPTSDERHCVWHLSSAIADSVNGERHRVSDALQNAAQDHAPGCSQ